MCDCAHFDLKHFCLICHVSEILVTTVTYLLQDWVCETLLARVTGSESFQFEIYKPITSKSVSNSTMNISCQLIFPQRIHKM